MVLDVPFCTRVTRYNSRIVLIHSMTELSKFEGTSRSAGDEKLCIHLGLGV